MVDAFIDESFITSGDEFFVVVASIVTTDRRGIERSMKRIKRIPKLKAHSEIKAAASSGMVAERVLITLALDPDLLIYVTMWSGKKRRVQDFEQLYQDVVARCCSQIVKRFKRIDIHLDKRYTDPDRQRRLEGKIREAIAVVPENIVRIFQEDSQKVKELAAPDFIAWAYTQRYGRGHGEYYHLIKAKVTHFENLSQ
jgi:hypothetical protein